MEKLAQRLKAMAETVEYGILRGAERLVDRSARPPTMDMNPDSLDFRNEIQFAKESLELNSLEYNVAIVGAHSSGKSSLINGLCHIPNTDINAARIDETNQEPKKYRASTQSKNILALWELPAVGVGNPSLTYYYDKKLYAYDLILLVCDRFRRADFDILRATVRFSKHSKCIIVRTKADLALQRILQRGLIPPNNNTSPTQKSANLSPVLKSAMSVLRMEVKKSITEGVRLAGMEASDVLVGPRPFYIVSSLAFLDSHIYHTIVSERYSAKKPGAVQGEEMEEEDEDEGEYERLDEEYLYNTINKGFLNLVRKAKTRNK